MRAQSKSFARLSSYCSFSRGLLIAAAAVLTLALCSAPPLCAAGGVTFTAPVNVSSDGLGTVPQIILDSSGNIDIAYGDVSSLSNCTRTGFCPWTGTIAFRRSTDGGKTFSSPVVLAQKGGPFSMALESDCTIDISYFANGDVFFAQSTDCGSSFLPLNVTKTGVVSFGSAIKMVVNQKVAEIAWQAGDGTPSSIDYAQGNATGFTAPRVLATQGEGAMGLFGMAVSNGTTDIMWWAGEFSYVIYFLNNVNGGQPTTAGGGGISSGPFFSLDPSGNMNILWGVQDDGFGNSATLFARSIGQSGKFGSTQILNPSGNEPIYGDDSTIATDPQGNIGVASETVQFTRSTDGGATFSTPTSANTGVSGTVTLLPQAVLPSTSFVGMAWGQGTDLWFNSSTNSGSTFLTPTNITNNHSDPKALQIITDSAGDVFMVWSGNDANGHDVFFARSVPPDFTISAAPAAPSVLAGGAAKFTVTLAATGGFSDPVNLSCSKLPSGAECAFDSSTVALSIPTSEAKLTVTTPPTLAQGNYTFTVDAASGSITHTQEIQIAVGGITSSVTPSSAVIAAGSSGAFAVTLTSTNGFAGQPTLMCSGAPPGMDCSFDPAQPTLAANASTAVVLTVNVAAKPSSSLAPRAPVHGPPSPRNLPLMLVGLALLVFSVILIVARNLSWNFSSNLSSRFEARKTERFFVVRRGLLARTRLWASSVGFVALALVLVFAVGLISCGGMTTTSNGAPGSTGTSATSTTASGSGGTPGTSGSGGTSGSTSTGSGSGSSGSGSSGSGGSGSSSGGSSGGSGGSGGGNSVTTQFAVEAQSGGATVNLGTVSITVP